MHTSRYFLVLIAVVFSISCLAQKRSSRYVSTSGTVEHTVLTPLDGQIEEQIQTEKPNQLSEEPAPEPKTEDERVLKLREELQQLEEKQRQENESNANLYYIAYLVKSYQFNKKYVQEIKNQFDYQKIMELINQYSEGELLTQSKGYNKSMRKYSR